MSRFDRTEDSYIRETIKKETTPPRFAIVQRVYEHTSSNDGSNFECDVELRGSNQPLRGVPIMTYGREKITVPEVDDLVVLLFIGNRETEPIIIGTIHTDTARAPLGESGITRQRYGNLYFEGHRNGDFVRISQKTNDDDSGNNANARVEIDDTGSDPVVNIDVENANININANGGTVKIGDENGSFEQVARKGDSVEVDDPDSGTITGQITGGSSNVEAS